MTRAAFVLGELLRASLGEWPRWLGFSLTVALVLASGSALALLQGEGDRGAPGEEWVVVAYVSTEVPDGEVNRLGWRLWEMEGVERVSFRFAEDRLPGGGTARDRALVIWTGGREAAARLEAELPRVAGDAVTGTEVIPLRRPAPAGLPPLSRVVSLVLLVLISFGSLVLARSAAARTLERWRNEWYLLRSAGVGAWALAGGFVGMVVLWGLVGCAAYVLAYQGARWALGDVPGVGEVAPGYVAGGAFPYLAAFVIGPVWAALAGAIALLSGRGAAPRELPRS